MTHDTERVIVYTLPECDVSEVALTDLRAQGINVEERNVMRKQEWFDEALKISVFVPIVIRGAEIEVGWKGALG
jgi:hypothetical protein